MDPHPDLGTVTIDQMSCGLAVSMTSILSVRLKDEITETRYLCSSVVASTIGLCLTRMDEEHEQRKLIKPVPHNGSTDPAHGCQFQLSGSKV